MGCLIHACSATMYAGLAVWPAVGMPVELDTCGHVGQLPAPAPPIDTANSRQWRQLNHLNARSIDALVRSGGSSCDSPHAHKWFLLLTCCGRVVRYPILVAPRPKK